MNHTDLRLAAIDGGNLRNAIAREASATVLVPMSFKENLRVLFNLHVAAIENEIRDVEKDFCMTLNSLHGSADRPSLRGKNSLNSLTTLGSITPSLIRALYACPHGVFAMSRDIPGLVQTSTNLASVKMREDAQGKYIEVNTSQRSSFESEKHSLKEMVGCVFALGGAEVEHTEGYPGWQPNPSSELLKTTVEAWKQNEGKDPLVVAIHAGLECGLFLEKYPSLDMVSFGPWMTGVHSPAEKLNIESTHRTYRWLLKTLEML